MPSFIRTPHDEELWTKAKEIVQKEYGKSEKDGNTFWRLVTAVYKKAGGSIGKSLRLYDLEEIKILNKSITRAKAKKKASSQLEEFKKSAYSRGTDSATYTRKVILSKHKKDYGYPENPPEILAGARGDYGEVWCQVWTTGMDWNCYYYMLDSEHDEPRLVAMCDDRADHNNEMEVKDKEVPKDIKRGTKAWQTFCENWVIKRAKNLEKAWSIQHYINKYDEDHPLEKDRNTYRLDWTSIDDPVEDIYYIPLNRLETPYQTEGALDWDKIKSNVEKMKAGEPLAPVEIGYNYDLHDGHHRLEASKIMKYSHVPCVVRGNNELEVQRAKEAYRELWKSLNSDIEHDIDGEKQAILDYKETLKDIKDKRIRKLIKEILADEENHKYNLKQVLAYLKGDKEALNEDKLQKSVLYDYIDPTQFPLESTGLLFRGVGQKELDFIRTKGYIQSKGKGNDEDQGDIVTCYSELYRQAEGYARTNYDLYNEKHAYVLAVERPLDATANELGEIETKSKVPVENIKAVIIVPKSII